MNPKAEPHGIPPDSQTSFQKVEIQTKQTEHIVASEPAAESLDALTENTPSFKATFRNIFLFRPCGLAGRRILSMEDLRTARPSRPHPAKNKENKQLAKPWALSLLRYA